MASELQGEGAVVDNISVVAVEQSRVSRQAREMEDLMLSLMLIMTMMAAVEMNVSISVDLLLFCQNPNVQL